MKPRLAVLVLAAAGAARHSNRLLALALVGELCGIVENEDLSGRCPKAIARAPQVPREDPHLADPIAGEETVGGLGVGPVLTGKRYALTNTT